MTKLLTTLLVSCSFLSAEVVKVYSERHYASDKQVFADFTEKTGIEVQVVKAGADELLARLKSEGETPQADVYITKDAADLDRASKAGVFQALKSEKISQHVPAGLRSPDDLWTALTMRGRVIVYAKDRVKAEDLPKTYSDLAKPEYRGKVLIRSSSSKYNRSLLASIMHNQGKSEALAWAQGIKNNMARPPQGGDRDQIRAVAQGLGDYAVTNTYYIGIMEQSDSEKDRGAAESVGVIFPSSGARGTHVNLSGGGIIKGAVNAENARKFLEYITHPDTQKGYQKLTSEYAIAEGVELEENQKAWGEIKPDTTSLHHLTDHYDEAVKLFGLVGWQ